MSCEAGPEVKRKSDRKYRCMKDKNAPEYGGKWLIHVSQLPIKDT